MAPAASLSGEFVIVIVLKDMIHFLLPKSSTFRMLMGLCGYLQNLIGFLCYTLAMPGVLRESPLAFSEELLIALANFY